MTKVCEFLTTLDLTGSTWGMLLGKPGNMIIGIQIVILYSFQVIFFKIMLYICQI